MNEILAAVAIISVVIMAVTQMVKQVVADNKWLPVLNVLIGILIGLLYALTIVGGQVAVYAWAGFISGLGAGGFYDLQANVRGLNNQRKSDSLIANGQGEQDNRQEDGE